ncbi:MAG: hypothetical protein LIP28_06640 [Deltaproteobacteria bacterium]|nr:hypothetical protein [Deltaproteobacteria bacterium]
MSIRSKFILVLLFCLAAVTAAICGAVRFYALREADTAFVREASAQLDRVEDIIHIYFKGAERAVKNLASLPEADNAALARNPAAPGADPRALAEAESALQQRLALLPQVIPGVEAAFCGYRNGSFHSSGGDARPDGYDARAESWYSDAAWGLADVSITDVAISEKTKSLVATVATRIRDGNGDTAGVAALVMTMGALSDTLRDVRPGRSGRIVLFDAEGRVLFDPEAQENLLRPADQTGPLLRSLMQLPAGRHEVPHNGTSLLAFSRVFPDTRWKAALLLDKSEQAAPWDGTFRAVLLVAAASCLGLALAGVLLAIGATKPLYALIRQSKALAGGDKEALAAIAGRGPDITALQSDIGQLTGRVMLLAQAEKEHAGEIEAYARRVREAEHNLSGKTAREAYRAACHGAAQALAPVIAAIGGSVSGIRECANRLHACTRTQALSANNAHTVITGLADDVGTMAGQAAETEKSADAVLGLIHAAGRQMRDALNAAQSLEETAATLAPGLDTLRGQADEMGTAANAMRDVAEEINVLGLKLSIEVSSAGEGGRKFAPATEEMRTLAERAMIAAASMDTVLAAMDQTHTAYALAVGKNKAAATRVFSGVARVENVFSEATSAVATTVEQIRVLATALEGLALAETLHPENTDAMLMAVRDAAEALKGIETSAASLETLTDSLASLAETFEAPPATVLPGTQAGQGSASI